MWDQSRMIISSPGCDMVRMAHWFPKVAEGTQAASQHPNSQAAYFYSLITVGSQLQFQSPKGEVRIDSLISGVRVVIVSDLSSIVFISNCMGALLRILMRSNKTTRGNFVRGNNVKMDRILQAYRKMTYKHQKKEVSQDSKGHKYLQNYYESHKVYANPAQTDRDKYQTLHIEPRREISRRQVRTPSLSKRQKTYQLTPSNNAGGDQMNLFLSEGRRKMVYDKLIERSEEGNRRQKLSRVKSARTYKNYKQMKGVTFRQPDFVRQTIEDTFVSRAVFKRLGQADEGEDLQKEVRKKNKQKIIIFQKGVLLRNKY